MNSNIQQCLENLNKWAHHHGTQLHIVSAEVVSHVTLLLGSCTVFLFQNPLHEADQRLFAEPYATVQAYRDAFQQYVLQINLEPEIIDNEEIYRHMSHHINTLYSYVLTHATIFSPAMQATNLHLEQWLVYMKFLGNDALHFIYEPN